MAAKLEIQSLTKRYQVGKPVINNFSFTAESGDLVALEGPNGSGKTTLLRLLSTAAFPTSGSVNFNSLSIHDQPQKYLEHAGIVIDDPELPEGLTAVELLEWIVRQRKQWTDENSTEAIAKLLDTLRLDERRNQLIKTYSSGMLKKVQIASALITMPSILIIDEPFRGLDDATIEALEKELKVRKEDGTIIFLASHRHDILAEMANQNIGCPDDILEA